jgi:hypothetical protein
MARPIVTLLSDFGTDDYYVAAMKAVLLRTCPECHLIDITHSIAPQDIVAGSVQLERAVASFLPGTVHLAVVDPGVGSERRILVAQAEGQTVVCPDNGLITWTARRFPRSEIYELTWRPPRHSRTFHGRDILAPAAGALAAGGKFSELTGLLSSPVLLDIHVAQESPGKVIHIDHFGNATTNVPSSILVPGAEISVAGRHLGALKRTYSDVRANEPIALIGSSDLLEIAVNTGSAARELGLKIGDQVEWR